MDVTRLLVRSDLGRRWRSWLALVVLVGVVGGLSIAAVAGWRRTTTAMERFIEFDRPANGYAQGDLDSDDVEAIPGVEAATGGDYFLLAPVDAAGRVHPEHLGQVSPISTDSTKSYTTVGRPIIVDGALPDPTAADEVAVDEEMADLYGLDPGAHLVMQSYTMGQVEKVFEKLGTLPPAGKRFDFTVTGIVRSPADVAPHQQVLDVVYMGGAEVMLTPAFDAAHRSEDVPSIGSIFGDSGLELRIDFDRTTPAAVAEAVSALDDEAYVDFSPGEATSSALDADRAIGLQATLLLGLGAVIALGGLVLIALALRRQLDDDRDVYRTLAAFGAPRSSAVRLAVTKASMAGLASVVVALAVAVAASPLAPVGHARRAEIDPGIDVDPIVMVVGAVAVLLVVVAIGALAGWRSSRPVPDLRGPRSSTTGVTQRLARAGMPPSIVAGVRAGAIGAGGTTVLATVFVAALGIVGALGFAASEARLATDPALWGWTFDAVVGDGNDPSSLERARATMTDDPMVEAFAARSGVESATVSADGRRVDVVASAVDEIKGSIEPRLLEGTSPHRDDEVALGGATARRLGVGVGDDVTIGIGGAPEAFRVSGIAVMNRGFDAERMGEGALLTPAGLEVIGAEADPALVLVRYADGVDPDRAYASLQREWGFTVLRPVPGSDVDLLHDVRYLPLWFSVVLAAVAAASLAFVLFLTIRRRRRDLAVLRTMGFDRRQLRSTVFAQAVTLVLPGALLGVLAGVVVGRLAWHATTTGMGAPEVQIAPLAGIVAVVVTSLALACLVAAVPARMASRVRPARVLRTE